MKNLFTVSGLILLLSFFLVYSCKKDKPLPPRVTTNPVIEIFYTTAVSGGNVTDEGSSPLLTLGLCWSTSPGATIQDNKTSQDGALGSFVNNMEQLLPDTKYYVRAYATNSDGTGYGNEVSFTTLEILAPDIVTNEITSITRTSAVSGGNIISYGGSEIIEYGIVWSTSLNPTTSDNQNSIGGTISGNFSCNIDNLTANTMYHVRAYATTDIGTTYGEDISFTTDPVTVSDVEGNIYNPVRIGDQLWLKENLKTTMYRNGEIIGTTATPLTDVTGEAEPKYQWAYDGDEGNVEINGRLYTWYAVTDTRGICPTGWHVPSNDEWLTLKNYLIGNGYGYEGSGNDIAKSLASTTGWVTSGDPGAIGNNPENNNSSGFTGVPGGARTTYIDGGSVVVTFTMFSTTAAWWTTLELDNSLAYQIILQVDNPEILNSYYGTKKTAASVRCLRDN